MDATSTLSSLRRVAAAAGLLLTVIACSEPGLPPAAVVHALAGADPVVGDEARFEGRVVQRLPAGGYTYFEIETVPEQHHWVATLTTEIPTGARVRVEAFSAHAPFESRRLARRFDRVLFGTIRPIEG